MMITPTLHRLLRSAGKAFAASLSLALVVLAAGCSSKLEPLMPTPQLYVDSEVGPLAQIPAERRWTPRHVYYVTNRDRDDNRQRIDYGNNETEMLRGGLALIGFGEEGMTWETLSQASRAKDRPEVVNLSIAGLLEVGRFTPEAITSPDEPLPPSAAWIVNQMNENIRSSDVPDIMIYVHGAKVNFYNSCAFAAQLDHFMGREMTSLAFSWPTRQNIFAYGLGGDVERARRAGPVLADVVEMLARHTEARRIHIVAWSAGGRVINSAFTELSRRAEELAIEDPRECFRLGTVYFAAADLPGDEFLANLSTMNSLANRLVITGSSGDGALVSGQIFMGGPTRVGQIRDQPLSPEEAEILDAADRLEYVNLSAGAEERGFDITGHRYWFNHPWASTDVILSVRHDLSPEERGLQGTKLKMLYSMPADYPERIRNIPLLRQEGDSSGD